MPFLIAGCSSVPLTSGPMPNDFIARNLAIGQNNVKTILNEFPYLYNPYDSARAAKLNNKLSTVITNASTDPSARNLRKLVFISMEYRRFVVIVGTVLNGQSIYLRPKCTLTKYELSYLSRRKVFPTPFGADLDKKIKYHLYTGTTMRLSESEKSQLTKKAGAFLTQILSTCNVNHIHEFAAQRHINNYLLAQEKVAESYVDQFKTLPGEVLKDFLYGKRTAHINIGPNHATENIDRKNLHGYDLFAISQADKAQMAINRIIDLQQDKCDSGSIFSVSNLLLMAKMDNLSYGYPSNHMRLNSFVRKNEFHFLPFRKRGASFTALMFSRQNTMYLAFKGTSSLKNVRQDYEIAFRDKIPNAFNLPYQFYKNINKAFLKDKRNIGGREKIMITGHSLGGAFATYFALELRARIKNASIYVANFNPEGLNMAMSDKLLGKVYKNDLICKTDINNYIIVPLGGGEPDIVSASSMWQSKYSYFTYTLMTGSAYFLPLKTESYTTAGLHGMHAGHDIGSIFETRHPVLWAMTGTIGGLGYEAYQRHSLISVIKSLEIMEHKHRRPIPVGPPKGW